MYDDFEEGIIPIIRLRKVLLVPIQVPPSDSQAQHLLERILKDLRRGTHRILIIDVSSLDMIDSYLTRIFYDIAQAAKSLGVVSGLVGIQPAVAITLVQMGIGKLNVQTFLNLDDAIECLEERL